jgi:hypothetical protein
MSPSPLARHEPVRGNAAEGGTTTGSRPGRIFLVLARFASSWITDPLRVCHHPSTDIATDGLLPRSPSPPSKFFPDGAPLPTDTESYASLSRICLFSLERRASLSRASTCAAKAFAPRTGARAPGATRPQACPRLVAGVRQTVGVALWPRTARRPVARSPNITEPTRSAPICLYLARAVATHRFSPLACGVMQSRRLNSGASSLPAKTPDQRATQQTDVNTHSPGERSASPWANITAFWPSARADDFPRSPSGPPHG